MTRHPSAQDRALRSAAGLLLFMLCFVLSATNGIAQARSNSLISSIAEKRANGLKVSFTYSPKYPLAGQPVQFADASTGTPGSWQWDFGDGSGSTERNPVHVYSVAGFRKITLIAADSRTSKKSTKTLTVMPASLQATFVFSPTTPGPGQTVQFTDTTAGDPTSWHWEFGDGTTSTAKDPSHAFIKAGAYTVSLTAAQ